MLGDRELLEKVVHGQFGELDLKLLIHLKERERDYNRTLFNRSKVEKDNLH